MNLNYSRKQNENVKHLFYKKMLNKTSLFLLGLFAIFFISSCSSKKSLNKKENYIIKKIKEKSKSQILVCAHRSFHRNAPENSLQSVKNAIKAGIDFIEIDIRTTKDSVLVLMHDKDIDRVTTGTGLVKNYTYSELQKFNLKIKDSVTNQKTPLLKEALKLAKGKIIPNLDLKAVNYHQLYKMLQNLGMEHEVISFIGKKKKVQEMLSIDSLYAVLPLSDTKESMLYYYKNTKSPLQHFTDNSFTPKNMEWIHREKELVFVNTLWDEDRSFSKGNNQAMDSVIALKPAIIQTNYPKLLLEYLKSKSLHN